MQVFDRDTGVTTKEPAARPVAGLVGALQGLYRAYQKCTMYPSGHPSIPQAVTLATREFQQALAARDTLVIGVARDQILLGEERLGEHSEPVRSLAMLLHDLDVAALEFRTGLAETDVGGLVEELARARRDHRHGADLVQGLVARAITNPRICPIDYRALSFGEGVQRGADGPPDMWKHLSRVLTDPSTYETSAPIEDLAEEVAAKIAELEGAGVGGLRSELHRQVEELAGRTGSQREALRARMANFVNALNPELRRNLLQVGPGKPKESLAIMAELADVLPAKDLVEALQNVDRVAGRAHDELLILLNKLNRISRSRPAVALQLEDTLDRWGVAPEALDDPTGLREALEEVFRRRDDTVYNPQDYHQMLTGLSRDELAMSQEVAASRALYRDPTDPEDVRRHAAEIAVLLLGRSDGDAQRPLLFGYVAANTDVLLLHRDFAPLREAAVAARADRTLKRESEAIRRAADGFLAEFQHDERIDRIIRSALAGGSVPDDALELLELGGASALDQVLEVLGERLEPEAGLAFRSCALHLGPEIWAETVARRAARGWRSLKPVFLLMRMMDPGTAVPLVKRLLSHSDSRVRREALLALCKLDTRTPQERLLAIGLGDRNLRVVATAIRQLAAIGSRESLELLGSYLSGNLAGALLMPETCRLAVELLSEQGEAGITLLAESLESMCVSLSPRKVRMARILAEHLAPQARHEAAGRALRRWRLSPARVIGRLLPPERIVRKPPKDDEA